MKLRALWFSMARSLVFAALTALGCRVLAPIVRPGPVTVPVRDRALILVSTPTPPRPTPTPTLPNAERWHRHQVDLLVSALRQVEPDGNWMTEREAQACVRYLLRHGVSINGTMTGGRTPLAEETSLDADMSAARQMLKMGADPNLRGENGEIPLEGALSIKHGLTVDYDVIEALLQAGADVNLPFADGGTALAA